MGTFQSLTYKITPQEAQERADAFRSNYSATLSEMVKALFHSDADPVLIADAERRMSGTSPEAAYHMFVSLDGYDPSDSARRLTIPLRAINGDLYPTDVAGVGKVKPDFDVVVMKHTGHYPMLEHPVEFDRLVAENSCVTAQPDRTYTAYPLKWYLQGWATFNGSTGIGVPNFVVSGTIRAFQGLKKEIHVDMSLANGVVMQLRRDKQCGLFVTRPARKERNPDHL